MFVFGLSALLYRDFANVSDGLDLSKSGWSFSATKENAEKSFSSEKREKLLRQTSTTTKYETAQNLIKICKNEKNFLFSLTVRKKTQRLSTGFHKKSLVGICVNQSKSMNAIFFAINVFRPSFSIMCGKKRTARKATKNDF